MTRSVLGRAQLLYIFDRLPEGEWLAAARAAGYEPRPSRPEKINEPTSSPPVSARPESLPAAGQPYRPGDLPDLPFWRIAAQRSLTQEERPSNAPAWLTTTQPWNDAWESDPNLPPPPARSLTSWARNARFLRRQLATFCPSGQFDVARLCGLLAQRRLPPDLPRLKRANWPGRLTLLLDLAPELRPYHTDFWRWVTQLRQILGPRLTLLITRSGHPGELERANSRTPALPPDDTPLVILSDAGLNAPDSPRYQHWREFGRRRARRGSPPLLLAPAPARGLTADIAAHYRCVLLEQGARLHPARRGAPGTGQGGEALLAALATGAYTEPTLLRELRLALAAQGTDIGSEYEAWNHPGVINDELACALRPAQRETARQTFDGFPPKLRESLLRLRQDGNRHLSPLVRLEETLTAGGRPGSGDWAAALERARRFAATLHQAGASPAQRPFAAFIAGMGRRRPELLSQRPELALAWGLAHRQLLQEGSLPDLPPGLRLQDLAWLIHEEKQTRPVYLFQEGETLRLHDSAELGEKPICHLAEAEVGDEYWQVEEIQPTRVGMLPFSSDQVSPPQSPQTLRLDTPLHLDPARRYRLTLSRQRLELEAVRRPAWAVAMGRDRDDLFAELKDGRRVYWVGRGRMWEVGIPRLDRAFRRDENVRRDGRVGFEFPHGFWWDEGEYLAWLEDGCKFVPPQWASRFGYDDYGGWAEFEIQGGIQRMRWIPPGEFQMGSPEDEPERYPDEQQHTVLLSQGYWLADTACTQALWRAVLGETPSRFEGDARPVEQVSWQDVVERFLPALNRLIPGLEAVLPSEAQWEYACRAGTQTPFWFGDAITTDQVNYDGNHPYGKGKKGEYREQTVEVKALPANDWGLYQMHGNVWEWCADWLGDYPREAVTDPVGPPEGRERVLRGGGWFSYGRYCRSANRIGYVPCDRNDLIGFRLARGPSPRPAASVGVAGVVDGGGTPASAPCSPTRGLGKTVKKSSGKVRKK